MLVFFYNKKLTYMSNCDFKQNFFKCNSINNKEELKKNLNIVIDSQKCLEEIIINTNIFLEFVIEKVLDIKKTKDDNLLRQKKLKGYIESYLSSFHESVSAYKHGVRQKFKLYIQKFDSSTAEPIYKIGSGTSTDTSPDTGNLPELIPYRVNFKVSGGISSSLFTFPSFSIVYDPNNISFAVKVWDVNIEETLKDPLGKKELIFNLVPELGKVSWKVFNIFDNIKNKQVNVFELSPNGSDYNGKFEQTATGFKLITEDADRIYNLQRINWGDTLELRENISNENADGYITLEKHKSIINDKYEFYFTYTGTVDTSKSLIISANLWNINSSNSLNYFNIQKELLESNQLLEFFDFFQNRLNLVNSVKQNLLKKKIIIN